MVSIDVFILLRFTLQWSLYGEFRLLNNVLFARWSLYKGGLLWSVYSAVWQHKMWPAALCVGRHSNEVKTRGNCCPRTNERTRLSGGTALAASGTRQIRGVTPHMGYQRHSLTLAQQYVDSDGLHSRWTFSRNVYSRTSLLGPPLGPVLGGLGREVVSIQRFILVALLRLGTVKSGLITEVSIERWS